jgi:3-oxoacyl-[acyl-carrier protein] reductase
MGKELATSGITVNCITPTVVDAGMIHGIDENRKADLLQRIPMRRFCRPDEVGDMVTFVASDACAFTTGAVFDLSGGRATW